MRAAAASRAPRRRPRGPATAAAASSPRACARAAPARAGAASPPSNSKSSWMAGAAAGLRAGAASPPSNSKSSWMAGAAAGARAAAARPRRAAGFRAGFGGAGSAASLSEDDDGRGARRAAGLRRGGGASAASLSDDDAGAAGLRAAGLRAAGRGGAGSASSLSDDDSGAAGALTGAGERAAARARARRRLGGRRAAARDRRGGQRGGRSAPAAAAPLRRGRLARGVGGAAAAPARRAAAERGPVVREVRGRHAQHRAAADGRPDVEGAVVVRGDDRARAALAVVARRRVRRDDDEVADAERRGRWRRGAAPRGRGGRRAARPRLAAGARRPRLVAGAAGDAVRPRRAGAAAGARAAARPRPVGFRRGRTVGAGAGASGCRAARQSADVGVGRELSFVASPPRRSCETRSSNSRPGWMASWRSWPLVMSLTMNGTRHSGQTYSSTVSSRRHAAQNAWPQGSISRSSWSRRSSQRRHVNAASSPAKFSVSPGSIFFPLAVRLRSSQGCMRRKSIYSARPAVNGAATHAVALAVVYAQTGARSRCFGAVSSSAAADAL